LRHLPVFGLFGRGDYRVQPIHVDDFAALAVRETIGNSNSVINAIGPETVTDRELVETTKRALGSRSLVVGIPPWTGYWAGRFLGQLLKDVVITREEIQGLMEERLYVNAPPQGTTKLTDWIKRHKDTLGRHYTSEMARRVDRISQYRSN
jgi:nucleoside-diphosphate-sugar epimerase